MASKLKECKNTFDRHLQKNLNVLNMSVEELLLYHSVSAKPVTTTEFLQNVDFEGGKNKVEKKPYDFASGCNCFVRNILLTKTSHTNKVC